MTIEIGVYSLADICADPLTGHAVNAKQRVKEIIEAAKLADEAGLDVFGVGEHHRLDYAVSAPPVVLSAIAQVTERIRLTSATTVLSTVDPVRLRILLPWISFRMGAPKSLPGAAPSSNRSRCSDMIRGIMMRYLKSI